MKKIGLKILRFILKSLAKATLRKYQPGIIGVTGSVGKTSAKLAIGAVLGKYRKTRVSPANFNNEIGLPLTILGDYSAITGRLFWLRVILSSIKNLVLRADYPEILVLEYGADKPGDLNYLLSIAQPQIGVITAVGEIPVHVEFYSGPEEVAREKAKLVESLSSSGIAVLNIDDVWTKEIQSRLKAKIITYGFNKSAQVMISNFENYYKEFPWGVRFKLEYQGNCVPVKLNKVLGRGAAYSAACAACVGLTFGLNLIEITEALSERYSPPKSRMNLLVGVKNTIIIDDCYNASPLSMKNALNTLKELPAKRKVVVLGDMLEIGRYSLKVHQEIGRFLASFVDVLFTIGPRAKFIAAGAKQMGMPQDKIFSYLYADQAKKPVELELQPGDVILVKGSRAMHLEKVVEEIKKY